MNINENSMSSASHCAMIRDWLESGKSITGLDALRMWGCFRLPSRIHDLRERGMDNIEKEMITLPNGKRVAKYFIRQTSS